MSNATTKPGKRYRNDAAIYGYNAAFYADYRHAARSQPNPLRRPDDGLHR